MWQRITPLIVAILASGCGTGTPEQGSGPQPNPSSSDPFVKALAKNNGDLPAALKSLNVAFEVNSDKQLTSLYLSLPDVTDESLHFLGDLSKLRVLSLSGSAITTQSVEHLAEANSLLSLDVSDTAIGNEFVKPLAKLSQLSTLNLSATQIDDQTLPLIADFPALVDLTLAGTFVSDAGIEELHSRTLRFVDLDDTKVTAAGIAELKANVPSIRQVVFAETNPANPVAPRPATRLSKTPSNRPAKSPATTSDNQRRLLTAAQQLAIQSIPTSKDTDYSGVMDVATRGGHVAGRFAKSNSTSAALEYLARGERFAGWYSDASGDTWTFAFGRFGANRIGASGMEKLRAVANLQLDLTEFVFSHGTFEQLTELNNLRSLRLTRTAINDESLLPISSLTGLIELGLNGTAISDEGASRLAELTKLRSLWLAETQITDAGLGPLVSLPHLEELDLSGTRVTDSGLPALEQMLALKRLNLCETEVSPAGIKRLQQALKDCLISR